MLQNTWYSVISPESCSSILWRTWEHKEEAAAALKLTAEDMKKNKLIDGVIKEPMGGAHSDPIAMYDIVKKEILKHIEKLEEVESDALIKKRRDKFSKMGVIA